MSERAVVPGQQFGTMRHGRPLTPRTLTKSPGRMNCGRVKSIGVEPVPLMSYRVLRWAVVLALMGTPASRGTGGGLGSGDAAGPATATTVALPSTCAG